MIWEYEGIREDSSGHTIKHKKSPDFRIVPENQGLFNGSKEARTPDLSRVRRTLIPAELCFRISYEVNYSTLRQIVKLQFHALCYLF